MQGIRQDELATAFMKEVSQWRVRPLPLSELLVGWFRCVQVVGFLGLLISFAFLVSLVSLPSPSCTFIPHPPFILLEWNPNMKIRYFGRRFRPKQTVVSLKDGGDRPFAKYKFGPSRFRPTCREPCTF